jgi:DNA-binding IclR family transcriptional regulator
VAVRPRSAGTAGARAYLDRDPALELAHGTLTALQAEIHHPVYYARRERDQVTLLAGRQVPDQDGFGTLVGRQLPAHGSALGLALLAGLAPDEVDRMLTGRLTALTPATITDPATLRAELAAVRERGWALTRDHRPPGAVCVAVAVGYRTPAVDALSCSIPAEHAEDQQLRHAIAAVTTHATALATTLRRQGVR